MDDNKIVKVGPWGGGGGDSWEFIPDGRIKGIDIYSGDYVDAIVFIYEDRSGNTCQSPMFGGGGGILHEIRFEDDEKLIKINGRFGDFSSYNVVSSLNLETNKNIYGAYGKGSDGAYFSVPVTKGKIMGFFGREGYVLDSIGVILSP